MHLSFRLPGSQLWQKKNIINHPTGLILVRGSDTRICRPRQQICELGNEERPKVAAGKVCRVGIFWDLDNICPSFKQTNGTDHQQNLLLCIEKVKGCACVFSGSEDVACFNVYANIQTAAKTQSLSSMLEKEGANLHIASTRNQSVDFQMRSGMVRFAQQWRSDGCMAIITSDQGYAATVRYCRSIGCKTVTVGAYRRDLLRPRSWQKKPLPAASDSTWILAEL